MHGKGSTPVCGRHSGQRALDCLPEAALEPLMEAPAKLSLSPQHESASVTGAYLVVSLSLAYVGDNWQQIRVIRCCKANFRNTVGA